MDLALYLPAEGGTFSAAEFDLVSNEPVKTYLIYETPFQDAVDKVRALIKGKDHIWVGPYMGYMVDLDAMLPETYDAELMDANTLLSLVGTIPAPWDESLPPLVAVEKMVDDIRSRISSILNAGI
jgi:hypothetical protein